MAASVLGVALLAAALSLLPYRLPGELPDGELQLIERPLCAACPPSQQIIAAGMQIDRGRPWLTVRFVAPPADARLQVVIDASATMLIFEQRAGTWVISAPRATGLTLAPLTVGARGDRVVVELPANASAGAALRSVEGMRFPANGMLPVRPRPSRGFTAIDLLIVAFAALGAWRGYRRGAVATATHLATTVILVVLLKAMSSAVAAATLSISHVAIGFSYGLAIGVAGVVLHAMASGRIVPSLTRRQRATGGEPTLGAVLGIAYAMIVAGMLLSVLTDQAVSEAVSSTIAASTVGAPIADGWRAFIVG